MLKMINFWPPFLGAGIKVKSFSPNYDTFEVELKLGRLNQNYVGTHFGGSLYAMCDPFFMVILIKNLGQEYLVWDKAASIRFKKPGRGIVRARFHIDAAKIAEIRKLADTQEKVEPEFMVEIKDKQGETVAVVTKLLWVKRKDRVVKRP